MSTVAASTCLCESITAEVVQCPEHFKLFRYGKRLASVSSIVRQYFPLDPSIPPEVLERARLRGKEVDWLFSTWLIGELPYIPAGTSDEARILFLKAKEWFEAQNFSRVEVQVLMGTSDYGGIVDFIFDGVPHDLKCNSGKIPEYARLQVAGYASLYDPYDANHRMPGRIIQVNAHLKRAAVREITREDMDDWNSLLSAWRVVQRRGA